MASIIMNAFFKSAQRALTLLALVTLPQLLQSMSTPQSNPYWHDNDETTIRWVVTPEELVATTPMQAYDKIIGISFNVVNNSNETVSFVLSIKMASINTLQQNPRLLCSQDLSLETVLNQAYCTLAPSYSSTYMSYDHLFDSPFTWNGIDALVIEQQCTQQAHPANTLEAEQLITPHIATYGMYKNRAFLLNKRPKIDFLVKHAR